MARKEVVLKDGSRKIEEDVDGVHWTVLVPKGFPSDEQIEFMARFLVEAAERRRKKERDAARGGTQGKERVEPSPEVTPQDVPLAESGGSPSGEPQPFLITSAEAARLLSVSKRTFDRLRSSGRMLEPVKLGRSVRWDADELRAWVRAGCPPRHRWKHEREKRLRPGSGKRPNAGEDA